MGDSGGASPAQKSDFWGLFPKGIQLGSRGTSEGTMAVQAKPRSVCYGDEKTFPRPSHCPCYRSINLEQSESTKQLGEEGEGRGWEGKQVINHHRYFCRHLLATAVL